MGSPSLKTNSKKQQGLVLVLSAPSGTGKTTVIKKLMETLPGLKFSISHTTRSPREGEQNGRDYFFVSAQEFTKMKEQGAFLEWAEICGNFYGTAFDSIRKFQEQGQDTLLELDVQGAESLRNLKEFAGVFIFILPPSLKELADRLNKRGTESKEIINQRLETGKQEISKLHLYDYAVTNHNIAETAANIVAIVRAEKLRAGRYQPTSDDIAALLKPKKDS